MLLSDLQYPHWLMAAGAVLVVFGFIGFAFRRKRQIESDQ
jgi:LPXTG-motif cell wall-anchored protein